ncbi:hypothetical protein H632_c2p0 [Helicosporidium sp. ATCC 50920]|nr:hypothetical protein H632_c2p0 [Helicosporidium sp. ATCC 50920]|eukprot:KDD77183.1 hypothetical protein H632_c2p0 [Helicosporidium sp. ATCC 50920]
MGVLRVSVLAALTLFIASAHGASFTVDHSYDGAAYYRAGTVELSDDVLSGKEATGLFSRNDVAESDVQWMEHIARQGWVYHVRINLPEGGTVDASIPAACWAQAGFATPLLLSLHEDGRPLSLAVAVTCEGGSEGVNVEEGAARKLTMVNQVLVQFPSRLAEPVPVQAAALQEGVAEKEAQSAGEDKEGEEEERKPKPDDRTWLQKNWMMLIPAGLLFMARISHHIREAVPGIAYRVVASA